ncbi:exo-rhamnogalacturonan lyase family protein [Streptococcus merionis]|uniref:Uncharacterized protein n=1 Tax=Streptococcus merionis TaxID=400065 RepID=A0A239SM81_9STRE|nr:hypothetical protein [Streptococcus merionis]SNU86545.1 Uncharacterised protein [Streptococcus merionis]
MNQWLHKAPRISKGVTWGHPWERGQLDSQKVSASTFWVADNPTQTSIMAYWPDGSVKWTKHAAIFQSSPQDLSDFCILPKKGEEKILVTETFNAFNVDTGRLTAKISKNSDYSKIFDTIFVDNKCLIKDLRLVTQVEEEKCYSYVDIVEVLENGSLKSVLKVSGHYERTPSKEFNRFNLYLTFYKDLQQIELTHTFEVTQSRNLAAIGLEYRTPLEGKLWNRCVGFVGTDGVYYEPVLSLFSRRYRYHNEPYARQVSGEKVNLDEDSDLLRHANENAIWDSFYVEQLHSRSYQIKKTTRAKLSKVTVSSGAHYSGSLYLGSEFGGVQIHLSKFWQKYPSAIHVSDLSRDEAITRLWFWSPEAEVIDFRHYDDRDHMLSAYEGMEEIRSTPVGIANSSTLVLKLYPERATSEEILAFSEEYQEPSRIVCSPETYHHCKVFAPYSLPRAGFASDIEAKLSFLFDFYQKEVEQREWYGYWNYGDFMHSYDPYRHMWLYDFGGYAWQNNELVPTIWLWLYFLRTGRSDVFELAEAMTRHTSEVDIYHSGPYSGLGSRHNVIHWGCQAKETRISMAWLHRYYYYLTGDERIGDILEEVRSNEDSFERLEPLREFYKRDGEWIPIRSSPDWTAVASNWYTQYERTGNKATFDKIERGLEDIYQMPYKFLSGPTVLFDWKTAHMRYMGVGNVGGYHMMISFGAPQLLMEIAETENHLPLKEMLAEYGKFYTLTDDEMRQQTDGQLYKEHFAWPMFATAMMAYAASHYQNRQLAQIAWKYLLDPELSGVPSDPKKTLQTVSTLEHLEEMPWVTTNVVSQWCLNIIICLELIGDDLP